MKQHRKWLFALLFLVFSTIGCEYVNNKSTPDDALSDQLVLRLAETYPKEHPSAAAAQKFADLAYERTNGRIKIKVYYNGELGNESEVLKQMQFGGIALARVNFLELSNTVAFLQEYIEPYAYESPEKLLEVLTENESNFSLKLQLEKLIPMVYYYPDLRCFYNNKVVIDDLDDFLNLKLKTSTSLKLMSIMQILKVTPINILTGDTFKTLSAGFMDGGETSLCEFTLSDYTSVVPYVTLSDYLYCPDAIIASSISLRDISRKDQQLLEKCALDTFEYQKDLLLKMQEDSIKKLEKKENFFKEHSLLKPMMQTLFKKERGSLQ